MVYVEEYEGNEPVLNMPVASLPSGEYVGPQYPLLEFVKRLLTYINCQQPFLHGKFL
ncbi:hypothetical protein JOD07_001631 [Defluviitalea raffinosedens]|nr:hypothetical protein [Defluviitalea raffinosedens]